MAVPVTGGRRQKVKKKGKRHAKSNTSSNKRSKNYVKANRGQGR